MLAQNSTPVKSSTCAQASTTTPKASYLLAGSRTLGLFTSIRLILLALRHNLTQELLAEIFGVLWVLWTLLKNGISRLLSGFGSILGGLFTDSVAASKTPSQDALEEGCE